MPPLPYCSDSLHPNVSSTYRTYSIINGNLTLQDQRASALCQNVHLPFGFNCTQCPLSSTMVDQRQPASEKVPKHAIDASLPSPIPSTLTSRSDRQPEPTARRTDGADLADLAHRTLILRVILGAVEGTSGAGLAGVDGGVRGTADVELAEGVEFDVDGVVGRPLADGLDLACLQIGMSVWNRKT